MYSLLSRECRESGCNICTDILPIFSAGRVLDLRNSVFTLKVSEEANSRVTDRLLQSNELITVGRGCVIN